MEPLALPFGWVPSGGSLHWVAARSAPLVPPARPWTSFLKGGFGARGVGALTGAVLRALVLCGCCGRRGVIGVVLFPPAALRPFGPWLFRTTVSPPLGVCFGGLFPVDSFRGVGRAERVPLVAFFN